MGKWIFSAVPAYLFCLLFLANTSTHRPAALLLKYSPSSFLSTTIPPSLPSHLPLPAPIPIPLPSFELWPKINTDPQVIYRELRDFLSLHAHYKAANFGTSVGGLRGSRKVDIPEFPKISIPYLKQLRGSKSKDKDKNEKDEGGGGGGGHMSKGDYAQASRDALQTYLVDLIRAVVSPPFYFFGYSPRALWSLSTVPLFPPSQAARNCSLHFEEQYNVYPPSHPTLSRKKG